MTDAALLIIDVQKGIDHPDAGERCNREAEQNMQVLLQAWRMKGLPVVHVQHCSIEPNSQLRPELPGNDFKDEVRPRADETVFKKATNSAFIGTRLEEHLRAIGVQALVVIGLTTDHCVSATTRMAADLGYSVTVVADATAAFEKRAFDGQHYSAELVHAISLATLEDEFATIKTTAELLAET